MVRVSLSVCIDAAAPTVRAALSDLPAIHRYVDAIRRAYCTTEHARGLGAVRLCELSHSITVKETMVAWEEGQSFTYVGEGVPMLRYAANTWRVEAAGSQTLVTTISELEVRGGPIGRLVEPLLLWMIRRTGRKTLASFKYLVENGRPYTGPARRLLPVRSSC